MKFEVSYNQISELMSAIEEALAEKDPKIKFDIQIKLIGIKRTLKPFAEELSESIKSAREIVSDLNLKYCKKRINEEGNEVPLMNGDKYVGLSIGENKEYDEALKGINDSIKSKLSEIVSIDCQPLKKEDLPRTVRGFVTEQLLFFVVEDKIE